MSIDSCDYISYQGEEPCGKLALNWYIYTSLLNTIPLLCCRCPKHRLDKHSVFDRKLDRDEALVFHIINQ
jgi:hypothetical protein